MQYDDETRIEQRWIAVERLNGKKKTDVVVYHTETPTRANKMQGKMETKK